MTEVDALLLRLRPAAVPLGLRSTMGSPVAAGAQAFFVRGFDASLQSLSLPLSTAPLSFSSSSCSDSA